MDNKFLYKVLWVDDQDFEALPNEAEAHGIDITHVRCWTDAKLLLEEDHFDDWSALILDCYCSIKPNGPENENFLREVFTEFNQMQGKNRILPWYVFSMGNKERFDDLMNRFLSDQRLKWDGDWEKGYYHKIANSISLLDGQEKPDYIIMLENIERVAKNSVPNKVRAKYPEAFEAARYFGGKIEHDLLNFLVKDYENDLTDTYLYYNWVRHIMEFIFDDGKNRQIFPPYNNTKGFGRLLADGSTSDWKIINFESFIPRALGHAFSFLLDYSDHGSHAMTDKKVSSYVKKSNNICLFRALLNIEMDLLVWYHELCKKVEDPQNTDYCIGKLWEKTKPITPLTNVVVQCKRIKEKDHFFVKKDSISVELIVSKEAVKPSKLKPGVFVDVFKWLPGNRYGNIADNYSFEGENGYKILYKKVTVYDQNNNVLISDFVNGKRNAKATGTGEQYQGLPHEVIITPIDGFYINNIVPRSDRFDDQTMTIETSSSVGKITITNLNDDLTISVEILPCPNLLIKPDIENGGSVFGGGRITPNSIVPIKATPSQGYEFVEWRGCEVKDKNKDNTSLTMPNKDVTLLAIFKKIDE